MVRAVYASSIRSTRETSGKQVICALMQQHQNLREHQNENHLFPAPIFLRHYPSGSQLQLQVILVALSAP